MKFFQRLTLIALVVLTAAVGSGTVRAQSVLVANEAVQQAAQTPQEICASADKSEPETREFGQAEDVLQDGVDYWAVLCTEAGPIYVDLYEAESPITVNSFVFLAQNRFFNNITFHRVLPGFMAQGGDPTGTGSGGPGYEFVNESAESLLFDRAGRLAMANSGPDTNGSQFFITYGSTPHLDGGYTIFGQVFSGQDTAELLTPRDPDQAPQFEGAKLDTVVIVEDPATVNATPDAAPTIEHLQALLDLVLVDNLTQDTYSLVEDFSHPYDLEQEATSWADNSEDLVTFMRDYLTQKGFVGTAAVLMKVDECPATAEENPIWAIGFQVSDYGAADAGQAVVFDNARSDALVNAGAFEKYEDDAEVGGRLYSLPVAADEWCGEGGVYYRYELPVGRYILTFDAVINSPVLETQYTPMQFMGGILNQLLYQQIVGTLERGNAALSESE
ncbi:MAG TPA: peptidylprolyl isomerase [Aggregatilineaceae bacterium]|nr:peptidylprolyl isomerase [Aggregatilineaceae bacterium]